MVRDCHTSTLKTKNNGKTAAGWYRLRNGKLGIDKSDLSSSPRRPWPPARPPMQSTNSMPAAAIRRSLTRELRSQKTHRLASSEEAPSSTIKAVDAEMPHVFAKKDVT